MTIESLLHNLLTSPNHQLLLSSSPYWLSLRTYTPANRMLMEVSSNKHLPDDAKLTDDQTQTLEQLGIQSRRQGYSQGKLLSAVQPTDIPNIASEIDSIFSDIFQSNHPIESVLRHTPSRSIYNRDLLAKMKESARNKDHQLRLQLYTILIDATFIALSEEDGTLIQCDTISGFPCFGVFTDEKHAFQYDPRGLNLTEISALQVIQKCIAQGAGSLWLNPKGETRGELYKNEIEELWRRTRRLRNQ